MIRRVPIMERLMKRKALSVILIVLIAAVGIGTYWYWTYVLNAPFNLKYGHLGIADCAPIYVALEKGFFAQEGLNVTLVRFTSGPQIIQAAVAGSIDCGHTGIIPALNAFSQGISLRLMTDQGTWNASGHDGQALIVRNDSNIFSLEDLKGKNYALHSYGTVNHLASSIILKQHGIIMPSSATTQGDVLVNLIPFANMPQALLSGSVDVIDVVEPYLTVAVQMGGRILYHTATSVFSDHVWHTATAFFMNDFVQKHKAVVDAFIRANVKAVDWIRDNKQGTIEIIAKYTGLDTNTLGKMSLLQWSESLNANGVNREMQLMLEYGWIKQSLNINELVYP
jgi:NitT/TauT family transport system substrate-binding protein